MKKQFFAAAFAVALLASCSVERENPAPQPVTEGAEVMITFDKSGSQFETRAFFDNTIEAEPYEKAIKSATIYVFDPEGAMVMRKEFSSGELSSLSGSVILPTSIAGKECTFYALANYNSYPMNLATENNLLKTYEYTSNFNGIFDEVSVGARKSTGITMSAVKKAVVQPQGVPTDVSFVLKRVVAKVAVKVSVDEEFAATLGKGNVVVNSIRVLDVPTSIWVFPYTTTTVIATSSVTYQVSKQIGSDYCNLFYLPEFIPAGDERITFRIDATFDSDGNTYSTDDRINLTWDVRFNGTGNGEIKRNGYYRINALICGFDALKDVKSLLTAGEWESPVTPDIQNLY